MLLLNMKIIIISEYNCWSSIGGTEYYTEMLIKGLVFLKKEVVFITFGTQNDKIIYKTACWNNFNYKVVFIPTRYFSVAEIKQEIVSSTWNDILPILKQEIPYIIHVHTYSTFFNIRHFEECAKYFNNIIFTSHIPGHFCPKGDLIKFNQQPCDGVIYSRCIFCLFSKNIKAGLSNLIFQYHKKVLGRLLLLNKLGVSLVCVSEWQRQHVISNGFDKENVTVIRQAIHVDINKKSSDEKLGCPFTVGYLGRLSKEKGSVFLLKLIDRLLNTSGINFVLGIPRNNSNNADLERLDALAIHASDRIKIMDHVNEGNKALFFKEIDCLLIPSFCIETGPIVLLEAILYNKHVLGPNTGGPSEFKKEFPDRVMTYSWNNLANAIEKILWLSKRPDTIDDPEPFLKEREIYFMKKHMELYNQLKAK